MFRKTIISLSLIVFTLPSLVHAEKEACTKKAAEAKVDEICKDIVAKGQDAKKDWPAKLLFKNCGDNYVWVQDTTPEIKMVMHPIKRRLDGQSLTAHTDENKFPLFVEFDKAAKAKPDGSWVDYMWAKPGAEKATPKTSYVKLCKMKDNTSWIAGSGVWKEDIK
jgi:methyl-accepting chemotaxis protein